MPATTETITIPVPASVAEAYRRASPERQRKMALYMALRLGAFEIDQSFEEAWHALGQEAEEHGLTDQTLDTLLQEIDEEREAERGGS